jgi:HlyD family secretion protein
MKKKWKIVLGALLIVVIAGVVIFESTKGLEVSAVEMKTGTIAMTFKEEGMIIPDIERPIYAIYGGEVIEVAVYEGQEVRAGDLLVVLSSYEIDSQIQQAQAQLRSLQGERIGSLQQSLDAQIRGQELIIEQAQRDLAANRLNLERVEYLYQAGAVPAREREDAVNMLARAENYLEQQKQALDVLHETARPGSGTEQFYAGRADVIQAQISLLEHQRGQTRITAPINGVVGDLSIQEGGIASPALTLMNIFYTDSYLVEVYVLAADIRSINIGMDVDLIISGRGEDITYKGTVRRIAPSAIQKVSALGLEEQRVKVSVEVDGSTDTRIFPGLSLDVEFTTDRRDNVLVVSRTALFPYNQGDAVWVVRDGRARVQPVETGFTNSRDIVITEGLSEGDVVILQPRLDGLSDGRRVSVQL